jgi:hypothetical protein
VGKLAQVLGNRPRLAGRPVQPALAPITFARPLGPVQRSGAGNDDVRDAQALRASIHFVCTHVLTAAERSPSRRSVSFSYATRGTST